MRDFASPLNSVFRHFLADMLLVLYLFIIATHDNSLDGYIVNMESLQMETV